jgi:hypothetical protein
MRAPTAGRNPARQGAAVNPQLFERLIQAQDPLTTLFEQLSQSIWTNDSFDAAMCTDQLEAEYLSHNEHATSDMEHQLYRTYFELYDLLAAPDPRRQRVAGVLAQSRFTLLCFDGLSLREIPALIQVLNDKGLQATVDFGLSAIPSSTEDFCQACFSARGPKQLAGSQSELRFTYHFVQKPEQWDATQRLRGERHVIWACTPDNIFSLRDHGAVSYRDHIIRPVQTLLRAVLDISPPPPLIITSDHGYVWQGGGAYWPLGDDEMRLMAQHFKQGRSTHNAPPGLGERRHVWQSGSLAAARGRFAWGKYVRGGNKLYKHEGISLMECLTPWVEVTP